MKLLRLSEWLQTVMGKQGNSLSDETQYLKYLNESTELNLKLYNKFDIITNVCIEFQPNFMIFWPLLGDWETDQHKHRQETFFGNPLATFWKSSKP